MLNIRGLLCKFTYFCNKQIKQYKMAKRKLSQTQIAFIIILWVVLVVYILMYAELSFITWVSIIMSGVIVLIPIYKSLKK